MRKPIPVLTVIILFLNSFAASGQTNAAQSVNIQVDGGTRFQQIDGIGVNANTRSWNGEELKPALELLLDSANATIWRVIVETVEKWEEQNDNDDPFVFNWDYYNKLYATPKFQKAWDMIAYLNKRGITVVNQLDLWDMPVVLVLLIALLGGEWAYRRHRGLA